MEQSSKRIEELLSKRQELVDTRLLNKPGIFSGANDQWQDWSFVFKAYAGAISATLQMSMTEAAQRGLGTSEFSQCIGLGGVQPRTEPS